MTDRDNRTPAQKSIDAQPQPWQIVIQQQIDALKASNAELVKACEATKLYWDACAVSAHNGGEDMSHPAVHQAIDTERLHDLANKACKMVYAALTNARKLTGEQT